MIEMGAAIPLMSSVEPIEVHNLHVRYPEAHALRDINLSIAPGTFVLIGGRSGSGKSTFTKLIMRFYDPLEGHIRIDGQNVADVTLDSLHMVHA